MSGRPSRVWDLPTRAFHWGLAGAFGLAMVSGEEPSLGSAHVAAGWAAAALVAFRVGWGWAGERWSRWSALGSEPGHDKLASVSVVAALVGVVGVVGTGVVVLGGEELRGPLAGAVSVGRAVALHQVHGALAWALVAWLGLHLAGIARKSWESRENLVRAMVDGRKRHDGPPVRARAGAAAVLVVGVAAVGIGAVATARTSVGPTLVQDERWVEACGECHLAFHPAVLPAASWDEMLAAEDHFGEFLGLDPETQAALSAYARANAAEIGQSELGVRLVAEGFTGDRVTDSATWRAAHRELDPSVFEREEVGGQVRCAACHPDAEQGTFDGRAADVPEPGTVRIGREP